MFTDRPSPKTIAAAAEHRVYFLADAQDPLWSGLDTIQNRAYRPNAPRPRGDGTFDLPAVQLESGSLIYLPKYPQDYKDLKSAYRALEVLFFHPQNGRITVRVLRVDQLFFLVPPKKVAAIEAGTFHEFEILRVLEAQ